MTKLTPRQRVLKKYPYTYALKGSCGWSIFGAMNRFPDCYSTARAAWAAAARRLEKS